MRFASPLPFQLQPRTLPAAICLALALVGGTASLSAQAASPAPAVAAPSIPAGSLEQALSTFAERAGITLSYSPDVVRGLSSPGL
ncbi:MAG: TonB-dependent siderophore receptor, partial [Pseudomonas sp.]